VSTIDAIRSTQADVAKLQSALGSVEDGLDTVETVAQAVSDARRGLRRALKLGLLLAVIGVVALVVVKSGPKQDDQTTS